ncbi:hypothetical protein CGMCC3_g9696 [Colletotrichum fructicola]|nr:uncharacterized protein CGMCC3_g9696 [Colletotrichum fructicola]KAE9574380.1 hypothetical protein CGMCC3_g9696 [Colletotrichum fructicola]
MDLAYISTGGFLPSTHPPQSISSTAASDQSAQYCQPPALTLGVPRLQPLVQLGCLPRRLVAATNPTGHRIVPQPHRTAPLPPQSADLLLSSTTPFAGPHSTVN